MYIYRCGEIYIYIYIAQTHSRERTGRLMGEETEMRLRNVTSQTPTCISHSSTMVQCVGVQAVTTESWLQRLLMITASFSGNICLKSGWVMNRKRRDSPDTSHCPLGETLMLLTRLECPRYTCQTQTPQTSTQQTDTAEKKSRQSEIIQGHVQDSIISH